MSFTNRGNPAAQYSAVNVFTAQQMASPHRIVQMLMEGALQSINNAKREMLAKHIAPKCEHVSRAIDIVQALRRALDHSVGGQIASNLDALYEYMELQLFKANVANDPALLDEVYKLLNTVKQGWDAIPEQHRNATAEQLQQSANAVAAENIKATGTNGKP